MRKVIGAGMMFLGSGCGGALSMEERKELMKAKPDEYYPLDDLLQMLSKAQDQQQDLVYATGKRWGGALKQEWDKRGITDIVAAMQELCKVYQEHHEGEVGEIIVAPGEEGSVTLTYNGPYPLDLIAGAYQAVAMSMGNGEANLERLSDQVARVSWKTGG